MGGVGLSSSHGGRYRVLFILTKINQLQQTQLRSPPPQTRTSSPLKLIPNIRPILTNRTHPRKAPLPSPSTHKNFLHLRRCRRSASAIMFRQHFPNMDEFVYLGLAKYLADQCKYQEVYHEDCDYNISGYAKIFEQQAKRTSNTVIYDLVVHV